MEAYMTLFGTKRSTIMAHCWTTLSIVGLVQFGKLGLKLYDCRGLYLKQAFFQNVLQILTENNKLSENILLPSENSLLVEGTSLYN